MTDNGNSDPLPFAQVDRAVKPKAATLATMVGVTYQHALGSLAEFWEACGDPRELERLWAEGKDEVVLSREEVSGRLLVAFGRAVDPDACRHLGLLEQRPEGFRVRGMSRYFTPIKARVIRREKASAGGRASAEARKLKTGTAQPLARSESNPPRTRPELAPNSNRDRSGGLPNLPEASDSGHRSSLEETSVEQARPGPVERVFEAWRVATKQPRAKLDEKRRRLIKARLDEGHTEEDLRACVNGYAGSPWHQGANDRNQKYLGLGLLLRDSEHVEAGMALLSKPAAPVLRLEPQPRSVAESAEIIRQLKEQR